MAEFFIVRKHRNSGVGGKVAHQVFDRFAGQWEAAIARRNTRASAFWRRAVHGHSRSGQIDELDISNANWNGTILRFQIKPE